MPGRGLESHQAALQSLHGPDSEPVAVMPAPSGIRHAALDVRPANKASKIRKIRSYAVLDVHPKIQLQHR